MKQPYKQVLQPCIIRIVKIRHKSFRYARDSIRIYRARRSGPSDLDRAVAGMVKISTPRARAPVARGSRFGRTRRFLPNELLVRPLAPLAVRVQYPISARSGKSRRVPVINWFVFDDIPESRLLANPRYRTFFFFFVIKCHSRFAIR